MKRKMAAARIRASGDARGERMWLALASAAVLAVTLSAIGVARAATYKWVDEKGVVHYTDKLPPDAVDKATTELSKQGVPVNKTDKAMTPEQRRAKEQEAEKAKEAARAQEEIARRDRALVASYTSEAEIDLARNRSLQTITNVILSSQAFSEQLNKRKVDIETKKAESKGKAVVATLDRELESIDAEMQRQTELVAQKNKEAAVITAKYDADKQRWRELSASRDRAAANDRAAASATPAKPAPSANGTAAGTATAVPTGTAKK
jgi:hypothetical protein